VLKFLHWRAKKFLGRKTFVASLLRIVLYTAPAPPPPPPPPPCQTFTNLRLRRFKVCSLIGQLFQRLNGAANHHNRGEMIMNFQKSRKLVSELTVIWSLTLSASSRCLQSTDGGQSSRGFALPGAEAHRHTIGQPAIAENDYR
jgi:hypothetical protein